MYTSKLLYNSKLTYNFNLGTLTLSGMCLGSPKIPAGIFFVKGFVFMTIYLLYETVEFKKGEGGQGESIHNPEGDQQGQNSTSNQLSEAELRTISATIMAHELILQRRYDDWLRATAESGLPSYEEIARVIAEEKKAAKSKTNVCFQINVQFQINVHFLINVQFQINVQF